MEVIHSEETSWWQKNAIQEPQEDLKVIEQKQPEQVNVEENTTPPKTEEGSAVAESKESTEVDEVPKVVENVSEFFEQLKLDRKYNFAFDADNKLDSYDNIADFIDLNVNMKSEAALKNINEQWYQSKPPAFQQFAHMAEIAGDDVNKLYDLINTQKTIEDFNTFDTSDLSQAEIIVENYLKLRNEPKEVIKSEIDDLKTRELLADRAEKYKPLLVAHYENEKVAKIKQEEENLQTFYKIVEENEKNVVQFLSAPVVSGMNLKDEDKDIIYSNLVYNPEIKGFNIYKKIEDLQREGKLDTLAKAVLLIENENRFQELNGIKVKQEVSQKLQRNIRFANDVTYESASPTNANNSKKTTEEEVKPFSFSS